MIFLLAALLLCSGVFAAGSLIDNADFSGTDIPEGWDITAYSDSDYSVYTEDGALVIEANTENDVRLCQMVKVKPNTAYKLTAEIAAQNVSGGRGVCLAVDNYMLDGTYAVGNGKLGGFDWTEGSLIVRTGSDQTYINIALRLGSYSEMSSGKAYFRSVELTKCSGVEAASAVFLENTAQERSSQTNEESDEARTIRLKSYLHLFIVCSVVLSCVFLWGFYRNRNTFYSVPAEKKTVRRCFALLILVGLLLRMLLTIIFGGHDYDMNCWIAWGRDIASNGTAQFYTAAGHEWYDYPPTYMLVLALITHILNFLHISANTGAGIFAFMLPAYIADACTGVVLMHLAQKRGFSESACLFLGGICIFNPAAVILSGAWGQIDSILTLLLLLSFSELLQNRRISAGAIYGLAIMTKWQALIYGPVLAAAYLLSVRSRNDAVRTLGGVAAAVAVILGVSLPFHGDQCLFWVVERFLQSAGGYDYASVEAYNFMALCGGNWTASSDSIFLGISYKAFGTDAIVLAVGISIAMLVRSRCRKGADILQRTPGTLYISAAFCMFMIFTFGHYMHERYAFPVMALLLFGYVCTREARLLACSMQLSVVLALNEATAMYVVSNAATSAVRGTTQHNVVVAVCSIFEVLTFAYTAYVCLQHQFADKNGEVARDA